MDSQPHTVMLSETEKTFSPCFIELESAGEAASTLSQRTMPWSAACSPWLTQQGLSQPTAPKTAGPSEPHQVYCHISKPWYFSEMKDLGKVDTCAISNPARFSSRNPCQVAYHRGSQCKLALFSQANSHLLKSLILIHLNPHPSRILGSHYSLVLFSTLQATPSIYGGYLSRILGQQCWGEQIDEPQICRWKQNPGGKRF